MPVCKIREGSFFRMVQTSTHQILSFWLMESLIYLVAFPMNMIRDGSSNMLEYRYSENQLSKLEGWEGQHYVLTGNIKLFHP